MDEKNVTRRKDVGIENLIVDDAYQSRESQTAFWNRSKSLKT